MKKLVFVKMQNRSFTAIDPPGSLFCKRHTSHSGVLEWERGTPLETHSSLPKTAGENWHKKSENLSNTEISFFLSEEGPYLSPSFY